MNTMLVDAIRNRRVLALVYEGVLRRVWPYVYGMGTKGHELLLVYQVQGSHNSAKDHSWAMLRVDEIKNLSDTGDIFEIPVEGHKSSGRGMTTIYAQV